MANSTQLHMAAYFASVGAGLSNVDIAAVSDGMLTKTNNHLLVPDVADFLLAAGFGVNMDRLLLNTPSLRYVGLPSLVPINNVITVPSPVNIYSGVDMPLKIPRVDEIAVQASQTDAGAQNMAAVVLFGFGSKPVPPGPKYRLRATAAVTGVVGAWANGSITMDTTLPQGTYSLVGLDVIAANVIAARLIFPGAGFRPGCIPRNAAQSIPHPIFTRGDLGEYGRFENVNIPNLEILLGSGANSAQVLYMDLVRVGNAGSA